MKFKEDYNWSALPSLPLYSQVQSHPLIHSCLQLCFPLPISKSTKSRNGDQRGDDFLVSFFIFVAMAKYTWMNSIWTLLYRLYSRERRKEEERKTWNEMLKRMNGVFFCTCKWKKEEKLGTKWKFLYFSIVILRKAPNMHVFLLTLREVMNNFEARGFQFSSSLAADVRVERTLVKEGRVWNWIFFLPSSITFLRSIAKDKRFFFTKNVFFLASLSYDMIKWHNFLMLKKHEYLQPYQWCCICTEGGRRKKERKRLLFQILTWTKWLQQMFDKKNILHRMLLYFDLMFFNQEINWRYLSCFCDESLSRRSLFLSFSKAINLVWSMNDRTNELTNISEREIIQCLRSLYTKVSKLSWLALN